MAWLDNTLTREEYFALSDEALMVMLREEYELPLSYHHHDGEAVQGDASEYLFA